jgi:hypothetical protein
MDVINFIRNSYIDFVNIIPKRYNLNTINSYPIKLDVSAFIDTKILFDIRNTIKTGNKYIFDYEGIHMSITCANANIKLERFLIFYTCFLVYLFKTKLNKPLTKLDVTIICYSGKKTSPNKNNQPLTSYHVNSGVTSSSIDYADVLIYRKEEVVKVLTHELIHAFGLDAKFISEKEEAFFNNYFKLSTNNTCKSVTINESFTDSLACLINTIIYTHLQRPINFDIALQKNIKKETIHILNQAEKVLLYNGYYLNKDHKLDNKNNICEHTHVISYYVLKAVVYTDLNAFIHLLSINHMSIDVPSYIDFIHKTLYHFEKFSELKRKNTKNLNMTILNVLHTLRV